MFSTVAVRCSALHCVAVCYGVLQCNAVRCTAQCSALQHQRVAVRCSVLQCVAVQVTGGCLQPTFDKSPDLVFSNDLRSLVVKTAEGNM